MPNNGKRYEIVEGDLFVTPVPRRLDQRIVTRLSRLLSGFVDDHQLGEVYVSPFDVVFSPFDIVEPDLVYFSNARESVLTELNAQGAPDLVVEVFSETTEKTDRTFKLKLYGKFGVQEYWMLDPAGTAAEIYRRGEEGLDLLAKLSAAEALTSPMFPGFSVLLRDLAE